MTAVQILGGVALFLLGLQMAREGLQQIAGHRMRAAVNALTDSRMLGLGVGTVVTAILQSSGATTAMLVGFASAGLITLSQAIAVILGADIGTTITVQIISLRVWDYALAIVAAGFALFFFSKSSQWKNLGQIVLGIGLLFLGMKTMAAAAGPLAESSYIGPLAVSLARNTLWGLLAAALLTAITRSGAATLGIVMPLAASGSLSIEAVVPMVLGANIGTSSTALLAAVGANAQGRRVAWAHFFIKVAGVIVVYPLLGPFTRLIALVSDDPARQVAWAHTFFNVGIAFAFLPLVGLAARGLCRMIPDRPEPEGRLRTKFLDVQALRTPALAFAQATREIFRMADVVQEMVEDCIRIFQEGERDRVEEVAERDDVVDYLDQEIRLYLTKLSRSTLTEDESEKETQLISLTLNLEQIGDVVENNLVELAKKKHRLGLRFSKEGWEEILAYHGRVQENFHLAMAALAAGSPHLARKVVRQKRGIVEMEAELREAHMERLHRGLRESIETSSIHLDVLSNLRRINSYVTNVAYPLLEQEARSGRG